MNSWSKFKFSLLKLKSARHHKITKSIGIYSFYKELRKNKWVDIGQRLSEHQFYYIIRNINKLLAQELINGNDVKLPHMMGRLEIRKMKPIIEFKDNKLKTNLPVNWNKTIKLWYEDKDAYKNKTLIRVEEKDIFKIYYNKSKAKYQNKVFYEFNINREIKKGLKLSIKNDNIDAYKY